MNNILKSKLNLNVKGNNTERFIKRLKNNNIEILNIFVISKDEINIKVFKKDYENIIRLKTVYEIDILDYYGAIKYKRDILNSKFMIIFLVIAFILIYILSNLIFSIDIITNDSKIEKIIRNELKTLGLSEYKFKKDYISIQNIKKEILNNHKDDIEWIEIENVGTKYIVRFEPRVINEIKENNNFRNIIAKKDAVIYSMSISSGQIIKDVNSYVKKGDVIVSGFITLNNNIKKTVSSKGIVYGETWYKTTITYPYKYYESKETGNKKDVIVLKLLNKEIELFNFNKYKTKNIANKTILKNNLLPIKIILQNQKETIEIKENNSEKELIDKAIQYSKNKINKNLGENEFIKSYKILSEEKNSDSITLVIFYSVVENIGEYQNIGEYEEITQ